MEINLWMFLTVGAVFVGVFLMIVATNAHKKSLKQLEVEELRLAKSNQNDEIERTVDKKFKLLEERIKTLETIVTDNNYELNKEISKLK